MSRIILKPTTDKLSLVTLCKLGSAGGSGLPPVTDVDGRAVIEVGGVAEFRTIDDSYVGGGWHAVLDLTARDAIPAEVRKIGLRCRVTSLSETYELVGGITNANWFLVTESPLVTARRRSTHSWSTRARPISNTFSRFCRPFPRKSNMWSRSAWQ